MQDLPKIAIDHDDYHAEYIGKTADGRQFFLTQAFLPEFDDENPGAEFIALYLFDAEGHFLNALIDNLGRRSKVDADKARALTQQRLDDLGEITFCRIEIYPFSVEKFDTQFGLIADEDEEGTISYCLEPGNFMAFYEPWDSGDYDT